MSEEAQEPKEIQYPTVDPALKAVQCVCQGKVWAVLSLPNLKDGSTTIKVLSCVTCGVAVELDAEARVGTTNATFHIDGEGRKHHVLKADPITFGSQGGEIGRSKI